MFQEHSEKSPLFYLNVFGDNFIKNALPIIKQNVKKVDNIEYNGRTGIKGGLFPGVPGKQPSLPTARSLRT